MAWVSVDEFAKLNGLTIQAVYKRIKLNRLDIMKDEKGNTLVLYDLQNVQELTKPNDNESKSNQYAFTDIEEIKGLLNTFISQVKSINKENLTGLTDSLTTGLVKMIETEKDKQLTIINQKNEEILTLKNEEIARLRAELEKKDKGLFKRLFGG